MLHILWSLTWRLYIVISYPLLIAMRAAQAGQADILSKVPLVEGSPIDAFEKLTQSHSPSLIVGACVALWLLSSFIGAMYPTPDDLKSTEISLVLRFFICLTGGLAAFLWVLNDVGSLNFLTPLWVGGIAFMSPQLIQIVPTLVKARLGLGGDK